MVQVPEIGGTFVPAIVRLAYIEAQSSHSIGTWTLKIFLSMQNLMLSWGGVDSGIQDAESEALRLQNEGEATLWDLGPYKGLGVEPTQEKPTQVNTDY